MVSCINEFDSFVEKGRYQILPSKQGNFTSVAKKRECSLGQIPFFRMTDGIFLLRYTDSQSTSKLGGINKIDFSVSNHFRLSALARQNSKLNYLLKNIY